MNPKPNDHDLLQAQQFVERLRDDFEFFCEQMWAELKLHKHHEFGPIERISMRHLAYGPRKRGVLAWRFFGKTYGVGFLALWRLLRNPNRRQVLVTISMPESRKRIKMIRQWIDDVWFLNHLAPRAEQRDGADGFDVNGAESHKDFSLGCKGMDGQITGIHGDVIADDIEDENNTITRQARENLFNRTAEFDAVAGENDEIVVIGTIHSEDSVYKKLSDPMIGYSFITIPILYPKSDQKVINLAPELRDNLDTGKAAPGDIVAPYRVTRDFVIEKMGRQRWFAMQFMLQINVQDTVAFPLKLADLIVFDMARDFGPVRIEWGEYSQGVSTELAGLATAGFEGDVLRRPSMIDDSPGTRHAFNRTILYIDPSGGGQSETAYYIGSDLSGNIFIHDGGAVVGSASNENIALLVSKAKQYNARTIIVEGNLVGAKDEYQNAWANLLRAEVARQADKEGTFTHTTPWNAGVEVDWAKGQKERRICNVLEPLFSAHRIIISRRAIGDPRLQQQITHVTPQPGSLEQSDRVDAFASLCRILTETTALDPEKVKQYARTADDVQIERMLEELGCSQKATSFMRF
jgi:hypothetical protein